MYKCKAINTVRAGFKIVTENELPTEEAVLKVPYAKITNANWQKDAVTNWKSAWKKLNNDKIMRNFI